MAAQALRDNMLMKGITTGRDIVGNSRGIAKLIQQGHLIGARLYSSGGVLSPTGGHGDWEGQRIRYETWIMVRWSNSPTLSKDVIR